MRQQKCVLLYGLLNTLSAVAIILANKVVLSVFKFNFPVCLTWVHSLVTMAGMALMASCGMFQVKHLPSKDTAAISLCYVGFIVFNNLSIQLNTVGFYQISKILITPCVVAIERVVYGNRLGREQTLAVCMLLLGITLATVSDSQAASNPLGLAVAGAAVVSSSFYQVLAGAKQRQLKVNANQLLHQAMPLAAALLTVAVPLLEPVGRTPKALHAGTLIGFNYTAPLCCWIALTSVLGLAVTWSAFLFIGASSPTTYNVVGHSRTVLIVACGVVLFREQLSSERLCGVACAIFGIIWYSVAPPGCTMMHDDNKAERQAACLPQHTGCEKSCKH